jgi:monovalent cation:H+ antiporter, CPA1 family
VLGLSRSRVADTVRRIGRQYRFPEPLVSGVADQLVAPPAATASTPAAYAALATDQDQLRLGIEALCQREREIVLEHFDARTISGRTVEELVRGVGRLLDRVRARGPDLYLVASAEIVDFSREFRLAHFLHRRFQIDRPLVDRLAVRFERLLVSRLVLESLDGHIGETVAPLVGPAIASRLRQLLAARLAMTTAALDALGAQYPAYATRLAQRFLQRVAIRHGDMAYKALFAERVIGPELYGALSRELQVSRQIADERPQLDLGLETRALLARVPLFAGLSDRDLAPLARHLRPRLAVPGERLIERGEDGDAMFFISSGTVEIETSRTTTMLSAGDFFGEMALVLHVPRQADATARTYCQLLVLDRKDFDGLAARHHAIRAHIDRVAEDRSAMNQDP